jgi:site-specific DNA-cytosine methylase
MICKALGYRVMVVDTNAREFGPPTSRTRLYLICIKSSGAELSLQEAIVFIFSSRCAKVGSGFNRQ